MAVIEKIRQRSALVIGVIGVALISFLVSDAISNNIGLFSSQNNDVGKIAGKTITYEEYLNKTEKLVADVERQQGRSLDEMTRSMVRDQVWNEMIQELVINSQYDELGIVVTSDELFSVVTNPVGFPQLMQAEAFQDENTKQFDPNKLINYIRQLESDPSSEQYQQWINYEENAIKPQIVQRKYNTLINKGIYRTKLEVEEELMANNKTVSAKIVGLSYNSIPDTAIAVTDEDMKKYLNEHPEDYKQEASRKLEYLVFDVIPSTADSAKVLEWVSEKKEQFANTTDDTLFIANNSETPFDTTYKGRGSFDESVESAIFSADTGAVIGPFYKDGVYSLYKILDTQNDTVAYLNGSQIIIKPRGMTKEDSLSAVERGNAIAAAIRKGADFEQMAKDSSQDYSTANKGGKIGWVKKGAGRLPEAVETRMFNASVGDVFVVRSGQGVHIVKVNEANTSKTVAVATLSRSIVFSNDTESEVYTKANQFAANTPDGSKFTANAEQMRMLPRISPDLSEDAKDLPNIPNAREVIRWAFKDGIEVGNVSDPIPLGDKYIVAHLVSIKEKGVAKVDDVKDQLRADVLKHKKALHIKEKITAAMSGDKSIDQLALDMGTIVNNAPNQQFSNPNLPYVGNDMHVLGALFGAEEKKITGPVKGTTGVYMVYVESANLTQATQDAKAEKERLIQETVSNVSGRAFEALKEAAEIEDFRYKFF